MEWKVKKFDELKAAELYEILRLRSEVFVIEQNCLYPDMDMKDQDSYHLFAVIDGQIAAYLRILPKGLSYTETSIGRVLVKSECRKSGIARQMLEKAISFISETLHERKIRISAQSYLLDFYKSLGFKQVSGVYQEDGIDHIEMLYKRQE